MRCMLGSLPGLALVAILAAALLPHGLSSQTVVGRVVEEGTNRPMSGAFVVLEDSTGVQQGGVLAGGDGRFVLRAPGPGGYRLVARFIGYADTATPFVMLDSGETLERTIAVRVRAVSLEGIRAEVEQRCRTRPGGSRMARVWEEAQKALEITDWTDAQNALRFNIVQYEREVDAQTLRVTGIRQQPRRGYYRESPYRSVPAAELAAEGYVQPAPGDQWDHFAPDTEVLLSDSFVDTHCFGVAESDDPGLVGLSFEPVPDREVPDIEGVLWVDRGTAELRRLDFTYRNLPYEHGDWSNVGGTVEFQRLATGMWIVRRWVIRMPLAATTEGGIADAGRGRLVLVSLREQGAEVREVATLAGEVLAEAVGATLFGSVTDSTTGEPLEGATVEIPAIGRTAVTGPEGAYRMADLATGVFDVSVEHPDILLLGGQQTLRQVELDAGQATRLSVSPDLKGRALALCSVTGAFADPVVLYGRVRDPVDSAGVPGALIRAFSGRREENVVADSTGGYALCLPRRDTVAVAAVGPARALTDPESLGVLSVPVDRRRVMAKRDLVLSGADLAASPGSGSRRVGASALVGTVLRHDNRQPVAGAMVLVRDPDGRPVYSAVTNDDGQFRFPHPGRPADAFDISVEHVGYGQVEQTVQFESGERLEAEVLLTERAIDIEPIVVTARRQGFLADMGFYDRLEEGFGMFVTRDEIVRRRPSQVTDLLVGRSQVRVFRARMGKIDVRVFGSGTRMGGSDCQPAVWIDGNLARDAGQPRTHRTPRGAIVYDSPFLTELVDPDEIEGMEIYTGPAGLPIRYGGSNADCGVIVIWTRRG